MLHEDADKALQAAGERAVKHDRGLLGVVGGGIAQLEAKRELVVELNRGRLPTAAQTIAHLKVNLGAVKRAVALVDAIGAPRGVPRVLERGFGALPHRDLADKFLRARGQLDIIVQVNERVGLVDHLQKERDLIADLLLGAEDMRVVLAELAHPRGARKRAGHLVSVQGAKLRHRSGSSRYERLSLLKNNIVSGQFIGLRQ